MTLSRVGASCLVVIGVSGAFAAIFGHFEEPLCIDFFEPEGEQGTV